MYDFSHRDCFDKLRNRTNIATHLRKRETKFLLYAMLCYRDKRIRELSFSGIARAICSTMSISMNIEEPMGTMRFVESLMHLTPISICHFTLVE